MVTLRPFPQERVDLVNKHNTRLCLSRQAEQSRHQFIRLSVPLVCEY